MVIYSISCAVPCRAVPCRAVPCRTISLMPIVLIQNTGSTVRERLWALSLAESSGWDSEDDTEEAHSDTVEIEYKVQFVTLFF